MRSSALPTLALALLMLAAGAFGTWFMLSQDAEAPRAPKDNPAAAAAEAPRPTPLPEAPMVRASEPAEATVSPDGANPAKAVTEGPVAKPELKPQPGRVTLPARPDGTQPMPELPEEMRKKLAELEGKLKEGGIRLPNPDGMEDWADPFGGNKVDFSATVRGTVVDTAGAPIAGAKVYAEYSETIESGDGENRRVAIAIMRSSDGDNPKGTPIATTDAAGSFEAVIQRKLGERASLTASLTASAEGFANSKASRIALKNGETKEGVKLSVRGAGSISGRVVDAGGRGIEGVKVTLGTNDGSFAMMGDEEIDLTGRSSTEAVTDSGGNFTATGLAEGRYKPRLRAAGWRQVSGPTEVTVKAGVDTRCPADFVVAAAAALKMTFVDAAGKPVRGWVSLRFKDGETQVKNMSGSINAEGAASFNDPPVGTFTVQVRVMGYAPHTVAVTVVEGQVFDMGTLTLQPSANESDEIPPDVIFPGD
ncbi:MAG: carboxypeptidase regulatory-like domain-containing protein [Planctomycetes bacterium]|nr:carboxypeptidase regulatory-like domain-containing protein [Planctomycetota bacterium]